MAIITYPSPQRTRRKRAWEWTGNIVLVVMLGFAFAIAFVAMQGTPTSDRCAGYGSKQLERQFKASPP